MKTFENWQDIIDYSNETHEEGSVKLNNKQSITIYHLDWSKLILTNFKLEGVKYYYTVTNTKTGKDKLFKEIVYIIYTEHHGVFIYCKSDLATKPIIKEKIKTF